MDSKILVEIKHPCGHCGSEIKHWRRNKKFCDEQCKSKHHNEQRELIDEDMKYVNKILAKNFDIMKKLVGDKDVVKIGKSELEKKGFNYDFVTQFRGDYRYCYALSWRQIENNMILISALAKAPYTNK